MKPLLIILTLLSLSAGAQERQGRYFSPGKEDSTTEALLWGKLGVDRAFAAETILVERDKQLGARNREIKALNATTDSLRQALAKANAVNRDYLSASDKYESAIRHLYSVNAILEKRDKRDFNLSIAIGGGLTGDKTRVGPGYGLVLTLGYTIFRF